MSKSTLNSLFNKLQLVEKESVFLFKENGEELIEIISKETSKKLEIIEPDAIYVFNKQPYILFFDLTKKDNQKRINEIHKQVWSFDQAPLVIFAKEGAEEYYNAFDFDKKTGKLSEILDKNIEIKCNFWNLQSGETLDWFYSKYKSSIKQKRVNQQLFENIKQTILLLKDKFSLEEELAKVLILRLIFIRYLIDRKIKIDNFFIEGNENEVLIRRKSLSDLIANPTKLLSFFNYLNDRFNGVLFKNSNIELTQSQSGILSKLFDPDGVNQDEIKNLFSDTKFEVEFKYEVFDFGIIPVELISGIYETLLDEDTKNATSAIYTPPFLVDYMLTETVDKYFEENKSTSECKIFDPAMGSGIFLVQGLRRMIERELEINPTLDNETFGKNIRKIAERNLFGIDINQEAIDVACFSIYVALLDYQEPGDIDIYHFPNLRDNNFFKSNFFVRKINELDSEDVVNELNKFVSNLEKIKENKLDFIIGNPPWKRNKSDYHIGWLNENSVYKKKDLGEKEIALSYLMRVNDFMNENTICSLIVTSTIFYNVSDTLRYVKSKFFDCYSIQAILDLSPVRRLVFDGEKISEKLNIKSGKIEIKKQKISSPALVIQFKRFDKIYSDLNPIHYKSVKSNRFFSKFSKNLVIEKFDSKEILQKHFIENYWMFKVALYGNTLDFLLLKKLEENKTKIIDLIDGKTIFKGAGIERGKNPNYYPDLVGMPVYENKDVREVFSTDNNLKVLKEKDVFLSRGREKDIFVGNKILFRENNKDETSLWLSYIDFDVVFRKGFFSIASKNDDFIKMLFSFIKSNLITYFLYNISCAWGVATRPAIRFNEELLKFPFIEPSETQRNKLVLLVNDLLKPYEEHYKQFPNMVFQGEPNTSILENINSIIEEIYSIKGYEKDLIDYVLNVSRYQFQDSKQKMISDFGSGIRNKKDVLTKYADVYIQEFEKIYDNQLFKVEVYELDHFITMNFLILDEKPNCEDQIEFVSEVNDAKKLFQKLSTLSISKIASNTNSELNLFIQKDIKGFEENSFYIIKPKEYKCWHRAMAWYDVAEFKESIQRAELERIRLRETNE